ncbi:hypothetical protein CMV_020425 [Castanea mollissima]|uniref:BZIP domain-containing protein n=1 Tax=Castanea mollissima TaxID=60419 RepID=A0A8J4VFT8_9ROSI|nr:hypothetical protein CMV_020425 [Castanea mollissima]
MSKTQIRNQIKPTLTQIKNHNPSFVCITNNANKPNPSSNPNTPAKETPHPQEHPVEVIARIRDYPDRKEKPKTDLQTETSGLRIDSESAREYSIGLPSWSGPGPDESDSDSGAVFQSDERKRKRMLSNRESARRSRMRKQKQLEDLTDEVTRLQLSNRDLVQKINAKERNYGAIESANNVLRAQHAELTDRLRSLNSVLQMIEEMSGFSVDIQEIPDRRNERMFSSLMFMLFGSGFIS